MSDRVVLTAVYSGFKKVPSFSELGYDEYFYILKDIRDDKNNLIVSQQLFPAKLKSFRSAKLKLGRVYSFSCRVENNKVSRVTKFQEENFEEEIFSKCLSKFLKDNKFLTEKQIDIERINFSLFMRLFENDYGFLKYLSLPFRLNTLSFFIRQENQDDILVKFKKYKKTKNISDKEIYSNQRAFEFLDEKIEVDTKSKKKSTNLVDFLS